MSLWLPCGLLSFLAEPIVVTVTVLLGGTAVGSSAEIWTSVQLPTQGCWHIAGLLDVILTVLLHCTAVSLSTDVLL
jgi:hypothetical protein